MSVVSLALTKAYIGSGGLLDPDIFGETDDELITLYLGAAETFIGNYIGRPLADLDPLPDDLKLAVLKLVAFYYEQREAASFGITMQIAPYGVTSIADAYRERWFGEDEPDAA